MGLIHSVLHPNHRQLFGLRPAARTGVLDPSDQFQLGIEQGIFRGLSGNAIRLTANFQRPSENSLTHPQRKRQSRLRVPRRAANDDESARSNIRDMSIGSGLAPAQLTDEVVKPSAKGKAYSTGS